MKKEYYKYGWTTKVMNRPAWHVTPTCRNNWTLSMVSIAVLPYCCVLYWLQFGIVWRGEKMKFSCRNPLVRSHHFVKGVKQNWSVKIWRSKLFIQYWTFVRKTFEIMCHTPFIPQNWSAITNISSIQSRSSQPIT